MERGGGNMYLSNMTRGDPIPIYALYGERAPLDEEPDALHWESISARSRPLDGRIAPHRHAGLDQFFWLERGGALARVDDRAMRLAPGHALFVPAPCVHGFVFDAGSEGHVLTAPPETTRGAAPESLDADALTGPRALIPPAEAAAELSALFALLAAEHAARRPDRREALGHLARLVRIWFARQAAAAAPAAQADPAGAALLRRFLALVEARCDAPPAVSACARELGVSPTHLSRVCRALTGRSAQALIHARVALEAKRRLAYTSMSVARIGWSLGFADPAYFSRFFARLTGRPPSRWRAEFAAAPRPEGAARTEGAAAGRFRDGSSRRPRPDT